MSAAVVKTTLAAAIGSTSAALAIASTAASFANDQFHPILEALVVLADVGDLKPYQIDNRIRLIQKVAKIGVAMADEMAGVFEAEERDIGEKLAALKAGAA